MYYLIFIQNFGLSSKLKKIKLGEIGNDFQVGNELWHKKDRKNMKPS